MFGKVPVDEAAEPAAFSVMEVPVVVPETGCAKLGFAGRLTAKADGCQSQGVEHALSFRDLHLLSNLGPGAIEVCDGRPDEAGAEDSIIDRSISGPCSTSCAQNVSLMGDEEMRESCPSEVVTSFHRHICGLAEKPELQICNALEPKDALS